MLYLNTSPTLNEEIEDLSTISTFISRYFSDKPEIHVFPKEKENLERLLQNMARNPKVFLCSNDNVAESSMLSNINCAFSIDEIIEIFSLRSRVYERAGYLKQCPNRLPGLNYDAFDNYSLLLKSSNDNLITGSVKVVFDSVLGVPSEKDEIVDEELKNKISSYKTYSNDNGRFVAELSRFVVDKEVQGKSDDFKSLFRSMYFLSRVLGVDYLCSVKEKDFRVYGKFGMKVLSEIDNYGSLDQKSYVLSWNTDDITPFFKKFILGVKDE